MRSIEDIIALRDNARDTLDSVKDNMATLNTTIESTVGSINETLVVASETNERVETLKDIKDVFAQTESALVLLDTTKATLESKREELRNVQSIVAELEEKEKHLNEEIDAIMDRVEEGLSAISKSGSAEAEAQAGNGEAETETEGAGREDETEAKQEEVESEASERQGVTIHSVRFTPSIPEEDERIDRREDDYPDSRESDLPEDYYRSDVNWAEGRRDL